MLPKEITDQIINTGKSLGLEGEQLLNYFDKETKREENFLREQRVEERENKKLAFEAQAAKEAADRQLQIDLAKIEKGVAIQATPPKPQPLPPRPPKLKCETFGGCADDTLTYRDFIKQFENAILAGGDLSGAVKLQHLFGYLTGYAFSLIKHLSINDDNYKTAISILSKEFDDRESILEEHFKKLFLYSPSFDPQYQSVKEYLNEVKAIVYELKSYEYNALDEKSLGHKIISFLIFHKLPTLLRRELVHKLNSNYPTLISILDNYQDAIKTILRTGPDSKITEFNTFKKFSRNEQPNKNPKFSNNQSFSGSSKTNESNNKPERPALGNFNTQSGVSHQNKSVCKFCDSAHSTYNCKKFNTYESRKQRCVEKNLCCRCTSPNHTAQQCPGREGKLKYPCSFCKLNNHGSALCKNQLSANLCINLDTTENSELSLMPIMEVTFKNNGVSQSAICLLDSGSQKTFISPSLFNELNVDENSVSNVNYDLKTFLGSSQKTLKKTDLLLQTGQNHDSKTTVYIDEDFDIMLNYPFYTTVLSNLSRYNHNPLAVNFKPGFNENKIPFQALIGVDVIAKFSSIQFVDFQEAKLMKVNNKFIPIGPTLKFLTKEQLTSLNSTPANCQSNIDFNCALNQHSFNETHINFVLNPIQTYTDTLECIFEESNVERRVDKFFDLETIGIKNSDSADMSNYDLQQIKSFSDSIHFNKGHYEVALPWKKELLPQVKSNHDVSLAILNRVTASLEKQNMLDSYLDVFKQQLEDNIIEEIFVQPKDYSQYVFIPHRPVFKTEQQVTTKIRPVFNCSLKVNNSISLNEASYQGVDLMNNLSQLLLKFRSNLYTLIADIKKAFLMIKLAKDEDKNRFCFFLRINNELRVFRYNTILFGYVASPFILNYVIKFHVSNFIQDECSKILLNNFYVDNLLFTSCFKDKISEMYDRCYDRMLQGGFVLRSWTSNIPEMRVQMQADNRYVEHQSDYEKMLGYNYSTSSDTLHLSKTCLDVNANTKRKILSETSKLFDPLGLYLPVTIRSKTLIRKLWANKRQWDEKLSEEELAPWKSLCKDVSFLSDVSFPRCAITDNYPCDIIVFADSSKQSFGFTVYSRQQECCNLIFAKARVAPIQSRSLPTLELLSVFLSLKCLPDVLSPFAVKFNSITIAVDAQIVLSWILSGTVRSKNVFAKNRLKDILFMTDEIKKKFSCDICFKYVPTDQNPADLLTRGVTVSKFKSELPRWCHGPSWLQGASPNWPSGDLQCLSQASKELVGNSPAVMFTPEPVRLMTEHLIDVSKYSSFTKVLAVASSMFKFVQNTRPHKNHVSSVREAAIQYLLKCMQHDSFSTELSYLKDPSSSKAPDIVLSLKLYLDETGIIRSKGRIDKAEEISRNVMNPILLGKHHHLTTLLISHYHYRVNHLSTATTLNKIRTAGFWIPQGRQAVHKALRQCYVCKKLNALPYKYPNQTDLPKARVNLNQPFREIGFDFAGPLHVKLGAEMVKMYILIFSCLATRAIHLELVPNMSTDQFILAFMRFTSMYGLPSTCYSDRAKSFSKSGEILNKYFKSKQFFEKFGYHEMVHIQNPAYSPWFGAIFERMFKIVKSCLRKTIGRSQIDYFSLLTLLSDIKLSINSRPLTYMESEQGYQIITPNSFIHPLSPSAEMLPEQLAQQKSVEKITRQDLLETLETRHKLLSYFEHIWHQSYLVSLRERSKKESVQNFNNRIKTDDIVLIKNPLKTRPFWSLGRVTDVYPGHDGFIRSVEVKRGDGIKQKYSLKHLFPLELDQKQNVDFKNPDPVYDNASIVNSDSSDTSDGEATPAPPPTTRTRRIKQNRHKDYLYY